MPVGAVPEAAGERHPLLARIRAATRRYNRYRSPEVVARLKKLEGRELTVIFRGSSCSSCGSYDYLEDFALEASDVLGIGVRLDSFEPNGTMGYSAKYLFEV